MDVFFQLNLLPRFAHKGIKSPDYSVSGTQVVRASLCLICAFLVPITGNGLKKGAMKEGRGMVELFDLTYLHKLRS